MRKRLLYILHLGFVEIRDLALAAGNEQIAALADAMEVLPSLAESCPDEKIDLIRFVLKNYQDKYQSVFDYPARLEIYDPPERY